MSLIRTGTNVALDLAKPFKRNHFWELFLLLKSFEAHWRKKCLRAVFGTMCMCVCLYHVCLYHVCVFVIHEKCNGVCAPHATFIGLLEAAAPPQRQLLLPTAFSSCCCTFSPASFHSSSITSRQCGGSLPLLGFRSPGTLWPSNTTHTSYLLFFYTGKIFQAKILHPKARKLRQIEFRDKIV